MDQLAIEVACRNDVVLATLTGVITPADAQPMARRLREVAKLHRGRCILDLSQLDRLCPEAVAALHTLQEDIASDGGELRLAAAPPMVAQNLGDDASHRPLRLWPTLDAALAA